MKENKFFTWDCELSQAVYFFNINIAVYKLNDSKYTLIRYYENENNDNPNFLIIFSFNENIKYYDLLYF